MIAAACEVIVCSYNRAFLIEELMANLVTNVPAEFKITIIDNGSEDETWTLLKKISKSSDREIRIIKHESNIKNGSAIVKQYGIRSSARTVWFFGDLMRLTKPITAANIDTEYPTLILRENTGFRGLCGQFLNLSELIATPALVATLTEISTTIIPVDALREAVREDFDSEPYAVLAAFLRSVSSKRKALVYRDPALVRSVRSLGALKSHWSFGADAIDIVIYKWEAFIEREVPNALNSNTEWQIAMADASNFFRTYRLLILRSRGYLSYRVASDINKKLITSGQRRKGTKVWLFGMIPISVVNIGLSLFSYSMPIMFPNNKKLAAFCEMCRSA